MQIPVFYLDSFTTKRFSGNPTAICCTDSFPSAEQMQQIATECNLPVTAFISRQDPRIFYFTPLTEIPACGHATLAAAWVMIKQFNQQQVEFITIHNIRLTCGSEGNSISLNYPKLGFTTLLPDQYIVQGLGSSEFTATFFSNELETIFIELPKAATLRALAPSYPLLLQTSLPVKEVVVTAASDSAQYDYLLRSFCPWIGIDEDPVTGSVHAVLAPYWSKRLNKNKMKARQDSPRGGEMVVNVENDSVVLYGNAVPVMEGILEL